MVPVVEYVEQIRIERMHVVDLGEIVQDDRQPVVPDRRDGLDLAHVELADAGDGPAVVDDRGGGALGLGEDDVDKVLGRGDDLDGLEVVGRHFFLFFSKVVEVEKERQKKNEPSAAVKSC